MPQLRKASSLIFLNSPGDRISFVGWDSKQGLHVQNQSHASVAQNGSTGNPRYIAEGLTQTLNNHFLFSDQLIDEDAEALARAFDDHQNAVRRVLGPGCHAEAGMQSQNWQQG